GIRGDGDADAGMELARRDHSRGRRCARERAAGAASAGAEFDLEQARDAPVAGAFGAALCDACRRLARIWRCDAPANGLDAGRLQRLSELCADLRGGTAT